MTAEQTKVLTTAEVAARYHELAQQEKWFQIQEEFFAENVQSIEPDDSPYLPSVEGKKAVRDKAEHFTSKITGANYLRTTAPLVTGDHFVVGREKEFTHSEYGVVRIHQLMLYKVENGKIVLEQFFY